MTQVEEVKRLGHEVLGKEIVTSELLSETKKTLESVGQEREQDTRAIGNAFKTYLKDTLGTFGNDIALGFGVESTIASRDVRFYVQRINQLTLLLLQRTLETRRTTNGPNFKLKDVDLKGMSPDEFQPLLEKDYSTKDIQISLRNAAVALILHPLKLVMKREHQARESRLDPKEYPRFTLPNNTANADAWNQILLRRKIMKTMQMIQPPNADDAERLTSILQNLISTIPEEGQLIASSDFRHVPTEMLAIALEVAELRDEVKQWLCSEKEVPISNPELI